MNRAHRRRLAKKDEERIQDGLDPESRAAGPIAAMARQIFALLEDAKRAGSVEAPMTFLYDKVAATLAAQPIAVACAVGCSHCCNGWVSATAPEILYVARGMRAKGDAGAERVRIAHEATRGFSKDERPDHAHPCPALENDACSLYETRPFACRLAASMNAIACMQVFRLRQPGTIPAPMRNLKARELYELAVATALQRADLSHRCYDLTAGLARVLPLEDAETAWLSGEDIFDGVAMDSVDIMDRPNAQIVYREAFGQR
jgi:Fe-S-cluster containining protein